MSDELQSVRDHEQRHSSLVRVVHADWLRACAQRQLHESEEGWMLGRVMLSKAPLQATARKDSQVLPESAAGSRGGRTAEDGGGVRALKHSFPCLCRRKNVSTTF